MKPNLKGIEASVAYLRNVSTTSSASANDTNHLTETLEISSLPIKSTVTEPIEGKRLDLKPEPSVQTQDNSNQTPSLPDLDSRFDSNQNKNNPMGTNPLPEELADLTTDRTKLQQIVQQIQHLYYEGPLVDGWLEFNPRSIPAGYHLCGLDAEGKMWTHPCPPEQLPSVSLAIARYQKILQLLKHKRQIEKILNSLIHSSPDK